MLGADAAAGDARHPGPHATHYVLAGLEAPVRIQIDTWGVPHIYAGRLYDAFYAQGFMAARDRLWQIDLWRKRGLGEMASDFGPAYAEGDRMARAVLFRGDMYREWLAYGDDAKRVAESFAAGVNAYVHLTERNPALLPPEFKRLDYRPGIWKADDIVRIRHHGLTLNFLGEATRAQTRCKGKADGERADWLRRELDPPVTPQLAEGLDPCAIPVAAIEKAYGLATAVARFPKEAFGAKLAGMQASELYALEPADGENMRSTGSNSWVVAPSRTSTGRPILANDPHRAHGAPALRYIVHLDAPGLSVIGAGEPFLPGISLGHNEDAGFGLTRFYMDQEDLYVYETNLSDAREYRYQGRWEPMQRVAEQIRVRGEAVPRTVAIDYTRHGPVLHAADGHAFALRAAWLDVGMAPYFSAIDMMRAHTWDQFNGALNRWGAPGLNMVYADRAGNIAWHPVGLTPVRPNWDGLTPVPGDGRYEWAGYRTMDQLPTVLNPAAGFVVTANENGIAPSHPAAKLGIGYEWSDNARARRLNPLLAAQPKVSVAQAQAWQNDVVSTPALQALALLKDMQANGDAERDAALALLRGWDGSASAGSAPAALAEVWMSTHLRPAALAAMLGRDAAALAAPGDQARVLAALAAPTGWLSVAQRDEVLGSSLKAAMAETTRRLGPDPKAWQWGSLHHAVFHHPMDQLFDAATAKRMNVEAGPMGGSPYTPMAASYRAGNFELTNGASVRMVLDVGNWDGSRIVNAPGQSGNPDSPHYRDLAPLWLRGAYFPLLYSRAAVNKATSEVIELSPAIK
ncbi:MAG: penicillin acylase family protein [Pseudomonadota bacterium]